MDFKSNQDNEVKLIQNFVILVILFHYTLVNNSIRLCNTKIFNLETEIVYLEKYTVPSTSKHACYMQNKDLEKIVIKRIQTLY